MDVIITTNSPGEVSAWVKPIVRALKREWPETKITVFIPPCTFASGREVPVVESFAEVERAIGPAAYLRYALLRLKPGGFKPSGKGFVLFLGGDLGHATLLGKRLGYPVYAYTERDAGHAEDIRLFFVPSEQVIPRMERKGVKPNQIKVVGNLMLDAVRPDVSAEAMRALLELEPDERVLNLFPGSRPHEVRISLPLYIRSAILFLEAHPGFKPVITLAPFITMENVRDFLTQAHDLQFIIDERGENVAYLKVNGVDLVLYRGSSYNTMQVSELAISLPGTNNVELAAMGVPTLVILPLNWPELIPLPGLVGIIGGVPFLGPWLKRRVVIPKILPRFPQVSPVNRMAGQIIMPELVGLLDEAKIARRAGEVVQAELTTIRAKLKDYQIEENVSGKIIAAVRADLLSSR